VKRFRFKSSDSYELKDSKFVFLQFATADLPGGVKIGYFVFPRQTVCSETITVF